ncbi:MAG: hypothetical protein KatS3mg117_1024 [Geminicoccaceae bacterium]|nr:MAG: hypothetical protein KatS3mg117_1024 [Geminicoccaceae bacterium]
MAPSRFVSAAFPRRLREKGRPRRIEAPIEKASGLPAKDPGHPRTVPRRDGTLLTAPCAWDPGA